MDGKKRREEWEEGGDERRGAGGEGRSGFHLVSDDWEKVLS